MAAVRTYCLLAESEFGLAVPPGRIPSEALTAVASFPVNALTLSVMVLSNEVYLPPS